MHLKATTDYAVNIVLFLALKKDYINSHTISTEMGISHGCVYKVAKGLKEAGIIDEKHGLHGGYRLKKDPSEVTLLEIVEKFEKTIDINHQLDTHEECCKNNEAYLKVRGVLGSVQSVIGKMINVSITEFLGV